MKRKITILSLSLGIITLLIGIGCYQIYLNDTKKNILVIQNSLFDTLNYELGKRLEDSGEQYSFSNLPLNAPTQPGFITYHAYSGDPRSPFPVISVHFLFIFLLAVVKLILFS